MQYRKDRYGNPLSALGYGCMRFTQNGGKIDILKTEKEILAAYRMAERFRGRPSVLIANTVKGKGVSFMEGDCAWHGAAPNNEQLARALAEIRGEEQI